MDTPQLRNQIKELQSQVSPYTKKKSGVLSTSFSFEGAFSSKKTYITIPVVVLIAILVLRPGFLYKDKPDSKGNINKSLSFQKIIVAWLIISFLLIIGLFGYNYNKKE